MMTEEEKKKDTAGNAEAWKGVKVGEDVTSGRSTSRVVVDGDTEGWDVPTEYGVKVPEKKAYKYNADEGFMAMFKPEEPKYDYEREERLKRVARVNAFGDLAKHLGALAGAGYAPTEKREENKEVLKAFSELDRLRDVYGAKREQYNDKLAALYMQDDASQRARHERDYDREYAAAARKQDVEYAAKEGIRKDKGDAYWKGHMLRVDEQNGSSSQYKDLHLRAEGSGAEGKGRSGGEGAFDAYIKGVGDLQVSKSAQVQVGTRIKDAMLDAGLMNEKDAAGLMAALKGSDSRTAFQSMLGYMRYKDVWDACKQFLGHGMTLYNAEGGGEPTDNDGGAQRGASSGSGFDYGNLNY